MKKRRVLVIGKRGREAALQWRCEQDPNVEALCVPGNAQTGRNEHADISETDFPKILKAADGFKPDVIIIGPDKPVIKGLGNFLREHRFPVVAPSMVAAMLEGSKVFAKRFMARHGIPTAPFRVFESFDDAVLYVRAMEEGECVVKADGPCEGKGVTVADRREEALEAVCDMMVRGKFGEAGKTVLIEKRLRGWEFSFFVLTDGARAVFFGSAGDKKRRFEGDKGKNTGSMGGYAPHPRVTQALKEEVIQKIVYPTIRGMAEEGRPYHGVLYLSLMVTAQGIFVIEYNARFGDIEAEVMLPLVGGDFTALMIRTGQGDLRGMSVPWKRGLVSVGLVLASRGYPDDPVVGEVVREDPKVHRLGLVFDAGTRLGNDGTVRTTSGRVKVLVGLGKTYPEAARKVYRMEPLERFRSKVFRADIAADWK